MKPSPKPTVKTPKAPTTYITLPGSPNSLGDALLRAGVTTTKH
jgi:hypothetical protein